MRWLSTLAVLAAWPALAQEQKPCTSDADCGAGAYCVMVPCAAPACPPNESCEQPACDAQGYCVEFTPPTWTTSECTSDADCPYSFKCEEQEMPCATTGCACAPCPGDGSECPPCDCPEPEPCTPEKVNVCTYSFAECAQDSECPEGFECHEVKSCSASGGAGCACPACAEGEECPPCECDAGAPAPPEESCTTYGGMCVPKEVQCASEADCPSGWECSAVSSGGTVSGGGSTGGGTACACPDCAPDMECPPCDCEDGASSSGGDPDGTPTPSAPPEPQYKADGATPEEVKYCMPQGWGGAIQTGSFDGGTMGGTSGEASGAPMDADYGLPGGGVPKGGGSAQDDGGNGGPQPPASPTGEGAGGSTTGGKASSASSCTASAGAAEPVALVLILAAVGVALLLRRRDA